MVGNTWQLSAGVPLPHDYINPSTNLPPIAPKRQYAADQAPIADYAKHISGVLKGVQPCSDNSIDSERKAITHPDFLIDDRGVVRSYYTQDGAGTIIPSREGRQINRRCEAPTATKRTSLLIGPLILEGMNNAIKLAAPAAALFLCAVAAAAPGWPAPGPMPPQDNQQLAHDILEEIVQIRSVHDVGTKAVAQALYARFKAAGFTDQEMRLVPEGAWPNQVNLVVRLQGKGVGKPVMWICHIDVVDARREDWSVPPFKLTEKDGFFYGRGTSDMKDEDAAAAASLIRLKKEGFVPDRDIIVAFTADEEVGLEQDGPAWLVKHDRDLVDAGWVMNPDGGSGEIVNGKRRDFSVETVQKTYMTFEWKTANKGGHSSEPRPDNAVYELASGLMRLAHYQFPYRTNATTRAYFAMTAQAFSGRKRADFIALSKQQLDPAVARRVAASDVAMNAILHTTCVATMLQAGVQENALPSSADATVQCRVFPGETEAQTLATLQQVAADPGIKVSLLHPVQPAPETVPDPKVMAAITGVVHSMWPGVPVLPEMAAGASDSIFTRAGGIPSYGVGGGWNDLNDLRMHGRDERKEIGDFYATVEFTYRLMKKLAMARSL